MKYRSLSLVGELDSEMFGEFLGGFQRLDAKKAGPIVVNIFSSGGSVDVGMAMYEVLRTAQNQIVTVGIGDVSSMAVLVLMAGDYRMMTQGTSILIHDGSITVDNSTIKAKEGIDENIRSYKIYCRLIAERSGLPPDYFWKRSDKELYMSALQARTLGLVDEIKPYRKFEPFQFPRSP